MEIVYYKRPEGNFGDDLNAILWRGILPQAIIEAPNSILVGVGSILDQSKFRDTNLHGKDVFVLGSGAAYGALPERIHEWQVLAVRGPLTAKLIDNAAAAITDSAYLIRALPQFVRQPPSVPSGSASSVLFMPHFESLPDCDWEAVSDQAGVEFVNVQWPIDRILEAYSRASLVVTEAMHGAIIADALRIPWIPVAISPEFSMFKWMDWTMSMELPIRVKKIPPPSMYKHWRYRNRFGDSAGAEEGSILDATPTEIERILKNFRSQYTVGEDVRSDPMLDSPIRRLAKRALTPFLSLRDERMISKTSQAIRTAIVGETYLSKESVLDGKMDRLMGCLGVLETSLMERVS